MEEKLDLIWGVEAMAEAIGRTARQTYHLILTEQIPARKVGERWVIERSKLVAVFRGEAA